MSYDDHLKGHTAKRAADDEARRLKSLENEARSAANRELAVKILAEVVQPELAELAASVKRQLGKDCSIKDQPNGGLRLTVGNYSPSIQFQPDPDRGILEVTVSVPGYSNHGGEGAFLNLKSASRVGVEGEIIKFMRRAFPG